MASRKYTACQLCDQANARDGRTVPLAVTTIAGVRICERHAQILVAIAAENGTDISGSLSVETKAA